MRKALLSVLLVLLIILIVLFMKNGIGFGSFQIYGFQSISDKNDELTKAISDANTENDKYTSALSKIETDVESLAEAKKRYLDLIAQSSESEIKDATQTKTYTIEYLWSKIGNHATKEGITLKMEVASSTLNDKDYRNLNFTVDGEYLAIVQFIYDIENDSDLDFIAENFNMTAGHATFTVKDVKIQRELTNQSQSSEDEDVDEQSSDDTRNNDENKQSNDKNEDEQSDNNENVISED